MVLEESGGGHDGGSVIVQCCLCLSTQFGGRSVGYQQDVVSHIHDVDRIIRVIYHHTSLCLHVYVLFCVRVCVHMQLCVCVFVCVCVCVSFYISEYFLFTGSADILSLQKSVQAVLLKGVRDLHWSEHGVQASSMVDSWKIEDLHLPNGYTSIVLLAS